VYTVIDTDNYKASGIEAFFMPGGEPHVKVPHFKYRRVCLFAKIRNWNDAGFFALVQSALRHQNAGIKVFMPYLPGARQDRCDGSAGFTAAVMGDLFNFDVHSSCFDIHSLNAERYSGIGHVYDWTDLPKQEPLYPNVVGIIAPDAGARDRAWAFREKFYGTAGMYTCEKVRDPSTGALSGYKAPELTRSGHYIVVDDICDGGGTFNLLAEELNKNPGGTFNTYELVVSHGIFSKGLDNLDPLYKRILTTNSWCEEFKLLNHPLSITADPRFGGRLKVVDLSVLIPRIMGEA
jgi:ribose-phosphate pyrophosphokinase